MKNISVQDGPMLLVEGAPPCEKSKSGIGVIEMGSSKTSNNAITKVLCKSKLNIGQVLADYVVVIVVE